MTQLSLLGKPPAQRQSSDWLRPYQREALNGGRGFPGIFPMLEREGAALLVMATGTGKTAVFSQVAERYAHHHGNVLVLAHRTELIEQAAARLTSDAGLREHEIAIEQASSRASDKARIVVGSVQTMQGRRLKTFAPDRFALVIVDEAHHLAAKSYRNIFEHFATARRLGVTATPDRLDGQGLLKWLKGLAYVYEIRDAILDQWLVPVRARMVFVDAIDLRNVKRTAGDLDEGQLNAVLMQNEALHGVAKPTVEQAGDRPTLVFGQNIAHATALAEALNIYAPGRARSIDGSASAELRRSTLEDFRARRFQYLVNCALYTEGVDLPLVSCVVMARPTESRSLYAQMAGRGTRLLGATWDESVANGKTDVVILDMVGNAGRHRLVCALDVLDASADEPVRARAMKKALDEEIDVIDALQQAEREEVIQRRLELVASVRYRVVEVEDQFSLLGVRPRAGRWGGKEATDKQREWLERAKIKGADKLDRGQASQVIDALVRRREAGLCTLPMAQILLRHGLDPDLTFDRAREVIDQIAGNRWQVPPSLLEKHPDLILSADAMAAKRAKLEGQ